MNLIGKVINNKYEILEKIGIGGMATVYRAKDKKLNREVALKVLKDEYTTDSDFIKRFNQEAQSAASLTHPNIVSVYDVGNEDEIYYIVMELIKGKTLKEIIKEEKQLSWKWSVNIAKQIALALDTAHKNGLVHRDIKPHNIIITEDGVAKVTDFGIAKAITTATMTAFGNTMGSVHYLSPEHARGGATDEKSDIYSLGIVMYEMVTGKVPFDADTAVSVALKQVQEKPVPPIELNRNIPEGLNQIILKAMEKDLGLRYASASEMLVDLEILNKSPDVDFKNVDDAIKESVTKIIPIIKPRVQVEEKDPGIFDEKPWLRYTIIGILALILLLIVIFVTVTVLGNKSNKETFIPNLTGEFGQTRLTKEQAIELLNERGFTNYQIIEEYNAEVEKDLVYDQDPRYQENFKVKIKSLFKVFVSKGEEMAKVPVDLIGKSKEEVQKILEEIKFKVEIVEEFNEDKKIKEGHVFKLDPEEDKEAPLSKPVKVYVSKGPEHKEVEIPDIKGYSETDAVKTLKDLKLKTEVVYQIYNEQDEGKVFKTDPAIAQKVKEGDKVKIYIAKAPKVVEGEVTINFKELLKDSIPKDIEVLLEVDYDKFINNEMISNQEENKKVKIYVKDYGTPVDLNLYINGAIKKKMQIKIYEKTSYTIP